MKVSVPLPQRGGTAFGALARFHVGVGARLAVRAAAPLVSLPILAVVLQPDPAEAVNAIAAALLGPRSSDAAWLACAVVSWLLAGWAAPRIAPGTTGWLRHLPVDSAVHRRSALLALLAAQAPLAAACLLLLPAAIASAGAVDARRLVAAPIIACGAALAAWPGRGAWMSRPLAVVASLLPCFPSAWTMLGAVTLLWFAERWSGSMDTIRCARRGGVPGRIPFALAVAARAVGARAFEALAVSLLPIGAMVLFLVNNDLTGRASSGAVRFGGGVAVVLMLSGLAEHLAVRRPVWPWERSLPAGSGRRITEDALILGAACLVPLAFAFVLDPLAALTVAAALPLLALRAAGSIRRAPGRRTGAAGEVLAEGLLLAAFVALLPWLALLALAMVPLAFRLAAARERRRKVSHWDETHHRTAGDPLSWSDG